MQGYEYGEQPQDPGVIKLNTNENPYPPSPRVADALKLADLDALRRYPDATSTKLRLQIATHHGLKPENVLVTNGGDEAIRLLATASLAANDLMVAAEPGYSLYRVMASIQNARYIPMDLNESFKPATDAALRCVAQSAKLVCVPNPNAPSGVLLNVNEIDMFASRYRNLLLVDEAYVDFVDPSLEHDLIPLLSQHRHLVLLRTFSKGYALAGARVGYLLADAYVIQTLETKVRDSYNVNALSQMLAMAALGDQSYAKSTWSKIRDERTRLTEAFKLMGYEAPGSQANFLLASKSGQNTLEPVFRQLRDQSILVRYFSTPRLKNCLRITVGTPNENRRLLDVLADC